jgi:hypothetical protein
MLALGDLRRRRRNVARNFFGDEQYVVFVRVDEVARMDAGSPDIHLQPKTNQVHAGMGDAGAAGKIVEPERVDFIEVAHVAVGDDADAAQAAMDVCLHLANIS